MQLLGGDQREALPEIEPRLRAKNKEGVDSGAVMRWVAFFENRPKKLLLMGHEENCRLLRQAKQAQRSNWLDCRDAPDAALVMSDAHKDRTCGAGGWGDLQPAMTLSGEDRYKVG